MNDTPELHIGDILTIQDAFAAIRLDEIKTIDDLKQRFSDRYAERFGGFLRDIALAYIADQMGPAGRDLAAEEARWSAQFINRAALIIDERVPDQLLTPELTPGVYWQIWNSDLDFAAKVALTTKAVNEGWSVADAKVAMGQDAERTGGSVVHCEAIEQEGRRVVAEGDEVQAIQIAGHPISIRVLKR